MIGIGLDITRAGQTVSFSLENLRVGTRVVQDLTFDPSRLFSDVAGTTLIAGPGAEVAAQKDARGVIVRIQPTLAARPKYAIEPASGVRNQANGAAAVGDASWFDTVTNNGITATKQASGITADGNAWARYQISGTSTAVATAQLYNSALARTPAASGQSWTTSALCRIESGASGDAGSGLRVFVSEETAPSTGVAGDASSIYKGATLTALTVTRAMTTGNQMRGGFDFRVSSGQTVDCIVYVEALQFELGMARTAWQANVSEFDVTEPGVRSVHALAYDRVDDWMQLSTAFQPAGNYTLAMGHTHRDGEVTYIFGHSTSFGMSMLRAGAGMLSMRSNFTDNQSMFSSTVAGRAVAIARVTGTGLADAYMNGFGPLAGTLTGVMTPPNAAGINATGRRVNSFDAPRREYGGVLIDPGNTPVTNEEIALMLRLLAHNEGITL